MLDGLAEGEGSSEGVEGMGRGDFAATVDVAYVDVMLYRAIHDMLVAGSLTRDWRDLKMLRKMY